MATQFFVGIVVAGAGFHILSEHLRDRRCMKYIILSKSSELKTIMYEAKLKEMIRKERLGRSDYEYYNAQARRFAKFVSNQLNLSYTSLPNITGFKFSDLLKTSSSTDTTSTDTTETKSVDSDSK